jgi:hypothetical protein
MPDTGDANVSSQELLLRWRKRRREILGKLCPKLRGEYRRLGALIRAVLAEQCHSPGKARLKPAKSGYVIVSKHGVRVSSRVPLREHKARAIAFLKTHGPATRMRISAKAIVPAGSLSLLLKGEEFEQVERGLWKLKEGVK